MFDKKICKLKICQHQAFGVYREANTQLNLERPTNKDQKPGTTWWRKPYREARPRRQLGSSTGHSARNATATMRECAPTFEMHEITWRQLGSSTGCSARNATATMRKCAPTFENNARSDKASTRKQHRPLS